MHTSRYVRERERDSHTFIHIINYNGKYNSIYIFNVTFVIVIIRC